MRRKGRGETTSEALGFAEALATGPTEAAGVCREHLKLAGIDRPEPFERSPFRSPIRMTRSNRWTKRCQSWPGWAAAAAPSPEIIRDLRSGPCRT